MRVLTLIILAFMLQGCWLTPEPKVETVTVYKTEYVKGIEYVNPPRPEPLPELMEEPEIYVLTPETVAVMYKHSISSSTLSEDTKLKLIKNMNDITKVAMASEPFALIGFGTNEYFLSARFLNELERWIKEANANMSSTESLDLTVLPDEESSGKD